MIFGYLLVNQHNLTLMLFLKIYSVIKTLNRSTSVKTDSRSSVWKLIQQICNGKFLFFSSCFAQNVSKNHRTWNIWPGFSFRPPKGRVFTSRFHPYPFSWWKKWTFFTIIYEICLIKSWDRILFTEKPINALSIFHIFCYKYMCVIYVVCKHN